MAIAMKTQLQKTSGLWGMDVCSLWEMFMSCHVNSKPSLPDTPTGSLVLLEEKRTKGLSLKHMYILLMLLCHINK